MIKLGLIGYPLGHSLSSVIHNAALDFMGIDGRYTLFETPPVELSSRIEFLKKQDFSGFNITIPLKISVIPFLSTIDSHTNLVGAVNTVKIENNELKGFNTDVYGFMYAIPSDIRDSLKGKHAAIIGAGGAARAVLIGLQEIGMNSATFYVRNIEKTTPLVEEFFKKLQNFDIKIKKLHDKISLSNSSIVINTTPLGMYGENEGISPLSPESFDTISADTVVYDLVYRPRMTAFLQMAKERNLKTVEGIEMLVLQGAKAFEIWTGKMPPVDIMKQAAVKNL
jgi:shikimate dehydrogenase